MCSESTSMFTIERQSCNIAQTEFFQILIEKRTTDTLDDIDHTDIATEVEGIAECVPALAFIIIEVGDLEIIDLYRAAILIHHIRLYLTRIKTDSHRESFKDTSRLIWRHDCHILMGSEANIVLVDIEDVIRIRESLNHSIFFREL